MSRPTPVGRIVIRPSDDTKAIIGITKGADPSLKPGMVYEIRKDDSGVMTLHEVGESCIRGPIKDEDTRQDAVFSWAHDLGLIFDAMGVQCVATLKEPKHIENIEGILEEQQHYRFMNMRQLGYAGSPVIEFFFPRFEAPRSRPKDVEQKLTEMFDILAADPEAALKMGDAIKEKYANIPELSKAEVMIWKRRALAADDTQEDTATTTEPIKGDTAPMSQPITEQDVAAYLEKFIQTSELVPDQMKALFIGRVTKSEKPTALPVAFIKEADDTLSVVIGDKKWPLIWEGMIGDSPEDALEFDHAVSEVGLLQRSYYTRVRRDSEDAPCPIQITKEENRTFSVVIGGKSWPIGSYGTIGHTVQDGEDFQKALLQHGSIAHAGGPYVVRIPSTDEIWSDKVSTKEHQARLARLSREFEHAMKARGGVGKSVGQIAYEGFYEHQSAPLYDALPQEEQLKWELAGTRAFTWMSVVPEEIEKEIQIIAGRKRLLILSQTNWGKRYREEHQEEATLLNSLAGFPRAPETKS